MDRRRYKNHLAKTFPSVLVLLALAGSTGVASAQVRIPGRNGSDMSAIQGVILGEGGLGVGGAHVVLRNTATGKEVDNCNNAQPCLTTGDGVFLIKDLPPGKYDIRADRTGFEPVSRAGVDAPKNDVGVVQFTMKATPVETIPGVQNVPRDPTLGTLGPPPPEPPPSVYQEMRREPAPDDLGAEPQPLEPLPEDEKIFTAVPNRWNYEFPEYHRYPRTGRYVDTQNADMHWWDPFNRNKLKGDYPVIGNRTFFELLLASDTFADGRRLPTPSLLGSERPDSQNFFGKFGQFALSENLTFSATLFHGDTAFRPIDWQIKFTPEVNVNYFAAKERGIVNIDVRKGTDRFDNHVGLQEAFVEAKLKDLSSEYDFVSIRAGIQTFNSDFRGFIFFDQEPGIRIFGNLGSNRWQYNLAAFAMLEKDTNSGLNRFEYRNQNVFIANVYRQDFLTKGYTIQASFHYDKDDASIKYDENHFLVRPAPFGNFVPHKIRSYYYGLTGDGHIKRINVTHAFYQVLGTDTFNEIAGRRVGINGQMAALELSLDKDWIRYRVSAFYSSGDRVATGGAKPQLKGTAHGFDTIFDNPNFAGGIFSFWNREGLRLLGSGVSLNGNNSLVPSLRSSKIEGQASYVNPGLMLINAGTDIDITTKMRGFINFNAVRFVHTAPLEILLFQKPIHNALGADSGIGVKYRPPLSDNIVITAGFNAFFPFRGFRDIYTSQTLYSLFTNVRFMF